MDKADHTSGSGSDKWKKRKLDDDEVVGDNLSSRVYNEEEAIKSLAKSFISGGIRPNTVKSPSFARFIRLLNPNFTPSVSLVEKHVLQIHEECKEKAKKFLNDFQGKLTLSYEWFVLGNDWSRDYIKGPVLHEDFVCMTAHFVDDNWKVKKWILAYTAFELLPQDEVLLSQFRNAVQDFEIGNKVSTLLISNGDGFDVETLDAIKKCIQEKGNSSVSIVYCCADLFRLMVNDVFSDLSSSLLEDVRMLVSWGRCSSTNWNVTLSHLQEAVTMKSEDAFSKDEIYDEYDKPSDEEWIKIETFCKLTGCIYKVAVELFEGGYSTSNVYFYLLAELKVMLNQELANADNDYFLCKAKGILKRFDKYWNHMFLILATASVLDPRFKMKYLVFYCSKNEADDESSKAETVLDYLRSLYALYAASDICQTPIGAVSTTDLKEEDEYEDGRREEEGHNEKHGEKENDVEEEDHDEKHGDKENDVEEEEDHDEKHGEKENNVEEEEEEEEEDKGDYDVEEEDEGDYDEEEDDEGEEEYDEEEDYDEEEEVEREARKNKEKKPDACKDFAFFQEFLKFEEPPREFQESELDSYLKEPVMEWNKDFRALEWWKEESLKYPILSRVARDILSIPISRATSYDAYVPDRREPPEFVVSLEAKVAN